MIVTLEAHAAVPLDRAEWQRGKLMRFAIRPYPKAKLFRPLVAALAGASLLFVAGCGSSDGSAGSTSSTSATSKPATDASTSDTGEFCSAFRDLAATRDNQRDGIAGYEDEAAWDQGIEAVEHIAAAAPEEIAPQAETYLQLVIERKALAASYGYAEVPTQATLDFGRAHAAMQQQANQLLAYAKGNCTGVK
jgi:hypothetical protein